MPSTWGVPAWVDTLSERMEAALAAGVPLARDLVFLSLVRPELHCQHPPGEQFAVVVPARCGVDARLVAGAGAAHTGFDSVWHVHFFARLGTDQQWRDVRTIRAGSRGVADLVRRGCRSLQLADLAATNTGSPLREPMRLLEIVWNPREPAAGWAWAQTVWDVQFRTDLTR